MPGGEGGRSGEVRNRPLSSHGDEVMMEGPFQFEPGLIHILLADRMERFLGEVDVDGVKCLQAGGRLIYPWGTYIWAESVPMAGLPGWWP